MRDESEATVHILPMVGISSAQTPLPALVRGRPAGMRGQHIPSQVGTLCTSRKLILQGFVGRMGSRRGCGRQMDIVV